MTRRWRLPRLLRRRQTCPECGEHPATETFCDRCGYDLVTQTRAAAPPPRGM